MTDNILDLLERAYLENWSELDLAGWGTLEIPPQIASLNNLKKLDISGNVTVTISPEIKRLDQLNEIVAHKCPYIYPTDILLELKFLRSLDLSDNNLTSLSARIGDLVELIYLDLSENNLTTLPVDIGKLQKLKDLILINNRLSELPSSIGGLRNLETLDLTNNELQQLPSEICYLGELVKLHLYKNHLKKLPPEISGLSKLDFLDLTFNQLERLPDELGELRNLTSLNLSGNKLVELPSAIGDLEKLKVLFLGTYIDADYDIMSLEEIEDKQVETNKLSSLPLEIRKLTELKWLDLNGNRLPIPPEILEDMNPHRIINYYFELQKVKRKHLLESKLLIVGQGSVGKTSLVQQILHGIFDQNQTKTDGISINQWTVENGSQNIEANSSSVKLNIWDFGGQEIMHATHQFFLTKRSLYLLVLDSRLTQEENRVEYWLKIIQSFGGASPVLIVGNKTDQHPLDIDRTGLQKKYPNIVGILETSAATGAGIATLKTEIAKQVDTLPHVRDLLPETWFTVKFKLEELGRDKNFITQDEYLGLCGANDVTNETSQHTLIGFLHDLGVILHFQDDPRLEALGILNPQWVTNGVYKILNSHELFQSQGILTLRLLNEILNLPEYPKDKRLFIVDMMKKFELCYDIISDKSFLIPDLLPKDEPFTGEWDGSLAFQYHYNVLPSSIISRFIVRMNPFVHKTVWRSGVVLKSGGNTALVKADTEDRKIYISVTGDDNTRRDFLSAIRMEFESIHKTITKIEAIEEVPHPDYPELVLDYSELIEFERQGVNEFPKKVGTQIVICNVCELLDGVRPSKTQATKVFVSYGHDDKKFVQKLATYLDKQSIEVWWDFDALKGGQNWQKEIQQGIKLCNFFLVVLTPKSVESEWVNKEITYANEYKKRIIPLMLEGCERPISIIDKQYVDFENQTQKAALKELMEILKSQDTNKP